MIAKIDKIENLGIYKNFSNSSIDEFKRYNLIYSWNDSGKSTLSRLFSAFGGKDLSNTYPHLKATVCTDSTTYTEQQFSMIDETIKVFNDDFIKENIDWDGVLKSILLFDEKNIDNAKIHNLLKKEKDELSKRLN
ncbi:MAG: AAA family ATPase [Campylobacter sp.]|nr:AAA family ATPase [Campylobacter sp.]